MEVGGRQEGAEVQGKTVHLKDGARRLPQVAARVRYARLMVVRAVVNNRHGQQGHFANKPTPRPSGCGNTTALPTLPRTGLAGAWDGISTERALHGQVTEALRDWSFPDRKLRFRPFNDAPSTLQP